MRGLTKELSLLVRAQNLSSTIAPPHINPEFVVAYKRATVPMANGMARHSRVRVRASRMDTQMREQILVNANTRAARMGTK